jgi:zinc protease
MTAIPEVARAPRPVPGAPREYRFPRFERTKLANGMQLVVARVPKLPLATVVVLVDAGAVCDAAGAEGTALLTAKMLLEGTESHDGAELAEQFERLGASIEASADWDAAAITMTTLVEHLPDAFDLLGEVVLSPAFRVRELERLKAERLAELLQLRAEPRGLADELFTQFLYQPTSRYARPEGGDEASVERIDRRAIEDFYRARYLAGGTTVVIAGDVTAEGAAALVDRAFRKWDGRAPQRVLADTRPARTSRAVHLVAKPDAPQSEIRIGHVGIPRNHPDFFPVNVMNALLGGLFNSRINLNLREAHAYTYGAFSGFEWRRQAGPFMIHTAVKSDITDAAARETLFEVDRIRAEAVTPDELSLATSYLTGVFPIRFETTSAIAAALSVLALHELPEDYYDRYRSNVASITTEQVLAAARRYLDPSAFQMLVVGDPNIVKGPLEAMAFGPMILYDAQGKPLA